jgi:RNA polymerase sigma-70 factor (ECF subfamily)
MHAETVSGPLQMSTSREAAALRAGSLVAAATGGDLDAFEELVRSLQRRVYGFAFQQLRDFDEAQDLTQEIFVKLYRNLDHYDPARPFDPWFWKLAANTAINYRRKRVPMPVEQPAEGQDSPVAREPFEHDPALVGALAELDTSYRLPLLLHYYADLSLEQVALSLNLSVPAIKSRLHRARAMLRNVLSDSEAMR